MAAAAQIIGVDCNVGAIQAANEGASRSQIPGGSRARFVVGDATSVDLRDSEEPFDIVLCQLVISIVGGVAHRKVCLLPTPSIHVLLALVAARAHAHRNCRHLKLSAVCRLQVIEALLVPDAPMRPRLDSLPARRLSWLCASATSSPMARF